MAAVSDLTTAEISAEITDSSLATWWDGLDALPSDVAYSEMFSKLLQAAYVAQTKKNAAAEPAVGEALNAYPAPTTGNVQTDTASGLQFFNATYSVQVVAAVDLNLTSPSYA